MELALGACCVLIVILFVARLDDAALARHQHERIEDLEMKVLALELRCGAHEHTHDFHPGEQDDLVLNVP
jgi:hypothetical protein